MCVSECVFVYGWCFFWFSKWNCVNMLCVCLFVRLFLVVCFFLKFIPRTIANPENRSVWMQNFARFLFVWRDRFHLYTNWSRNFTFVGFLFGMVWFRIRRKINTLSELWCKKKSFEVRYRVNFWFYLKRKMKKNRKRKLNWKLPQTKKRFFKVINVDHWHIVSK